MKTRKLFAILTLVAFMMTLLPVAAFAAPASVSASLISVDASSKPANYDPAKSYSTVEVTVALRDNQNAKTEDLGGNSLYIWAERSDEVVSDVDIVDRVSENVYTAHNRVSWVEIEDYVTNGVVEVDFASGVAGKVAFKAAIAPKNTSIITVATTSRYHIGSVDFEWKQLGAKEIKLVKVNDKAESDTKSENWSETLKADGTEYKLTFEVVDGNGRPLSGEKVKFSLNKSGAHLNKTEATTNVLGQVEVKVYAYKADDYRLTVEHGSKVIVVELDFGASDEAFEISAPDTITDKIAVGYHPTLEFKLYDVFGNRIYGQNLLKIDFDDYEVTFNKKPSASDLEDDDLSLEPNSDDPRKANVVKVKFTQDIDVAGTYEVKVKLPNGKFAIAAFEAAEQGKISRMVLDIKESYLAYGSKSSDAKVKYYDDNNVYYEDENLAAVELSVSNSALAKIEGKQVVAREAKYNDYSSGKVVVTAINTARGLVATDEIVIGSVVAGLDVAVPEEDALVGEAATITYQLVNQNGDPIAFDQQEKINIDVDAYVISQPDGSDVDINLPLKSDYQNSLSRTGKLVIDVESDTAGSVVFALVVKGIVDDNDPDTDDEITLSTTTEVKFVAERVKIGAENVTLFIGSTNYVVDGQPKVSDLAPFIQDNRTFVPVRVVAEALGAEVEWDEATQTVTIAREDLTATLTIGSNEITLSDGTVVVSDVAPFIKEGRTVLPFRVIGEKIFGAEVEAVPAADGRTIAVTFEQ